MKTRGAKNNLIHWLVLLVLPMLLVVFYASLAKTYLAHENAVPNSGIGPVFADSN